MANALNPYAPPSADEVFAVEDQGFTFSPSNGLAAALCWLLGFSVALNLVESAALVMQIELLDRMHSGGSWTMPEVTANDARIGNLAILAFVLLIATGVVWFLWQARTSKNARALGAEFMEFGPNAWGWFFCPVVNLWRPLNVISELWRVTAPEQGKARERGDFSPLVAPSWFMGWWLPWIGAGFVTQASAFLARDPDTMQASGQFEVAANILVMIAGVFAIRMVRLINQRERERAATQSAL